MGKTNDEILELIKSNATINEICEITGLSNRQLLHRLNMLQLKGYDFSRKYYYDGEIVYNLNKELIKPDEISLITTPNENNIEFVIISDIHTSSEKERIDLLYEVYDFCAKEGINIIINAGDLIDGLLGRMPKKNDTIDKQIEYLIKIHPYDKNILNFVCLGNHDINALNETGQNLESILFNRRLDIVPIGFGTGILNIKNDKLIVRHPRTSVTPTHRKMDFNENTFLITGHSHIANNSVYKTNVNIGVPTLSDLNLKSENYCIPGFIKATLQMKNGLFTWGIFENYIFLDKLYRVNQVNYQIHREPLKTDIIKYEEDRNLVTENEQLIRQRELTQIEKFNKRYNR